MVESVDEETSVILDNLSSIRTWVQLQAASPKQSSDTDEVPTHYIGGIVPNFHVMLSLQEDEDVVISLTSRNPQQITDTVTFDYNHRAFVPKTLRYSYDKK